MKKWVLITGGEVDSGYLKKVSRDTHFIIAVDHGCDSLFRLDILPHILIGDLDSVTKECMDWIQSSKKTIVFRFSSQKDDSDTELAFQALRILVNEGITALIELWKEYQYPKIDVHFKAAESKILSRGVVLGAMGTRMDHSLSNLWIAFAYLDSLNITFYQKNSILIPMKAPIQEAIKKYEGYPFVSIFPVSDELKGLTIQGVRYPLTNAMIQKKDASWLISNEILNHATISVESGEFYIIYGRD